MGDIGKHSLVSVEPLVNKHHEKDNYVPTKSKHLFYSQKDGCLPRSALVWSIVHCHFVFWGFAMFFNWSATGDFWGVTDRTQDANMLVRNIIACAMLAVGLAGMGALCQVHNGQTTRVFSQAMFISMMFSTYFTFTQTGGQHEMGRLQALAFNALHLAFYLYNGCSTSKKGDLKINAESFPWPRDMHLRSVASRFFNFACMGYFVISFLFFVKPDLGAKLMWFNDAENDFFTDAKGNFNLSPFWHNFIGCQLLGWCLSCWAALRVGDIAVKNWCQFTFFAFLLATLTNFQAGASPMRIIQDAVFTLLTFVWGYV